MVRGFSRFVPFLFLGLLREPTRNSTERVRDTIRTFPQKKKRETPGFGNPPVYFLSRQEGSLQQGLPQPLVRCGVGSALTKSPDQPLTNLSVQNRGRVTPAPAPHTWQKYEPKIGTKYDPNCFKTRQTRQFCTPDFF